MLNKDSNEGTYITGRFGGLESFLLLLKLHLVLLELLLWGEN